MKKRLTELKSIVSEDRVKEILSKGGISFLYRVLSLVLSYAFFIFIGVFLINVNDHIPELQVGYKPSHREFQTPFSRKSGVRSFALHLTGTYRAFVNCSGLVRVT